MRAVVQRVAEASVVVAGEVVGAIEAGLLVLVAVAPGDGAAESEALAAKLVGLRIFPDDDGKMNRAVADIGGRVLVVSQFTLLADASKGRRPSFVGAAPPEIAEPEIERLAHMIRDRGVPCATGSFGATMEVRLVNDGPVTLVLDVADGRVTTRP